MVKKKIRKGVDLKNKKVKRVKKRNPTTQNKPILRDFLCWVLLLQLHIKSHTTLIESCTRVGQELSTITGGIVKRQQPWPHLAKCLRGQPSNLAPSVYADLWEKKIPPPTFQGYTGARCSLLDTLLHLYFFLWKHSKDTFLLPLKNGGHSSLFIVIQETWVQPKRGEPKLWSICTLTGTGLSKLKEVYSTTARLAPCMIQSVSLVIISMWYLLLLFSGPGCLQTSLVTQSLCFLHTVEDHTPQLLSTPLLMTCDWLLILLCSIYTTPRPTKWLCTAKEGAVIQSSNVQINF